MRCTQLVGLSSAARRFLNENGLKNESKQCAACGHWEPGGLVSRVYDTESGRQAGMFDDGPSLNEYTLKSGERVREVVQCSPWSSGPCIFLCLEREDKTRFCMWRPDEIEENI